jgi:hypothetical protein
MNSFVFRERVHVPVGSTVWGNTCQVLESWLRICRSIYLSCDISKTSFMQSNIFLVVSLLEIGELPANTCTEW